MVLVTPRGLEDIGYQVSYVSNSSSANLLPRDEVLYHLGVRLRGICPNHLVLLRGAFRTNA